MLKWMLKVTGSGISSLCSNILNYSLMRRSIREYITLREAYRLRAEKKHIDRARIVVLRNDMLWNHIARIFCDCLTCAEFCGWKISWYLNVQILTCTYGYMYNATVADSIKRTCMYTASLMSKLKFWRSGRVSLLIMQVNLQWAWSAPGWVPVTHYKVTLVFGEAFFSLSLF
jgi:hypothetical protein